ncbi:DNA replication licensing [Cyclospora cayetanensis]|uniref:DNA helicase n=1 Tax=Cyclospora cayetanensis TaxID=88456 RepID=A0A1D3CVI7_9EIME|nr:DNA replication licensing [Cyclospora cayetanensis]
MKSNVFFLPHPSRPSLLLVSLCCLLSALNSHDKTDAPHGGRVTPFLLGAEGSLNVHSCVADFLVSSLRDLTYVAHGQLVPEKVVFPVCDSLSGPNCPHLQFPLLFPEGPSVSTTVSRGFGGGGGGSSQAPAAYAAHLHRPLVGDAGGSRGGPLRSGVEGAGEAEKGAPRSLLAPVFLPVDSSMTFLPLGVRSSSARVLHHRMNRPYINRGQYIEDGIGDVSAQSLSDAISNAIGHLGALTGGTRDIWGSPGLGTGKKKTALWQGGFPSSSSFVCFYTGESRSRKDCHDLAVFSSLPQKYTAEVAAYHSGWNGSSHLLLFNKSRAPFVSPYLEENYGPSSYRHLLNYRGPPEAITTFAELVSAEGSLSHANLFVPFGIWVTATPRRPLPSCGEEDLEASRRPVLLVRGIQEEEVMFSAEVPLSDIPEVHGEGPPEVPREYRFVNALDFIKSATPLRRVDVLRFSYGMAGVSGSGVEPIGVQRPLHCAPYHAALGAVHLLVAEKALSNRVFYAVDAATAEGKALQEKAHAVLSHRKQQEARKEALAEARGPLLKQLLGGPLPKPWRAHMPSSSPAPTTRADEFSGNETEDQRESGVFMGVVLWAQGDAERELLESSDVSSTSLPLNWQENQRIKFGRFDSMPYQFADLRRPLKKATLFMQEIPAEAPVIALNQLPQVKQVFYRKPALETHGHFKNPDLDSSGKLFAPLFSLCLILGLSRMPIGALGERDAIVRRGGGWGGAMLNVCFLMRARDAASIAPALFGMIEVKRACACLLFGGTAKIINDTTRIRGDINVLLLGDPSVAKSQVLKFVSKLAPISVYTSGKGSSAAGLTAAVMRDRHGVFSLEGGCMCLADGGVVCVDEFDKMQERDVVAMHEAMEQQTISISKAGINTVLNSRCAVLAAANPSFGSFDDAQDTTEQHEFKATILSRFDLIFMLRDKDDYEKDTRLCEHILNLHAGSGEPLSWEFGPCLFLCAYGVVGVLLSPLRMFEQRRAEPPQHEEGEIIPFEVLRHYIQFARQQQQPLLSHDARDALKNFYVQTRQEVREDRRSVTRKIPITLRQLESLVRIAESFARMELAPIAQASHVKRAIDLFSASTAETAKHALVFESLTPLQQKAVKLAEDALMGRLQPGQRALRRNIVRDLQQQGYDKLVVQRALSILVRRGDLQERGDRSIRRP